MIIHHTWRHISALKNTHIHTNEHFKWPASQVLTAPTRKRRKSFCGQKTVSYTVQTCIFLTVVSVLHREAFDLLNLQFKKSFTVSVESSPRPESIQATIQDKTPLLTSCSLWLIVKLWQKVNIISVWKFPLRDWGWWELRFEPNITSPWFNLIIVGFNVQMQDICGFALVRSLRPRSTISQGKTQEREFALELKRSC